MKQLLERGLKLSNNEKALAIAKHSDTLDEAVLLFTEHCEVLRAVDWNIYIDVLFIVLHIPQHLQYIPELDVQVDNYLKLDSENKLRYVITYELYCQIHFIQKSRFESLIELIHRHLGLPVKGKYLVNMPLLVDIIIYGKWFKYDALKSVVENHIAMVDIPSLYLKEPKVVKEPSNKDSVDQIKSILPHLLERDICLYLDYFSQSVEQVVNAGLENNLPLLSGIANSCIKETETNEVLKPKTSNFDENLKKLTLLKYSQQLDEEKEAEEIYESLYDTNVPGEEVEINEKVEKVNEIENILISYYMSYGAMIFLKENRKSTVRTEILNKLKWSNEQLEGWYIMQNKRPEILQMLIGNYRQRNSNRPAKLNKISEVNPNPTRSGQQARGRGRAKRKFRPL